MCCVNLWQVVGHFHVNCIHTLVEVAMLMADFMKKAEQIQMNYNENDFEATNDT